MLRVPLILFSTVFWSPLLAEPLKGAIPLLSVAPNLNAEQTFTEELERDLPLKRQVPLSITHSIGNLTVQGWVQDRVRVTLKKRILGFNEAIAKAELKKLDLVTLQTAKSFELRVGHTRGTDLVTKLRDEKQSQVVVDLEIKAPYQMDLTISPGDHKKFTLQQWRGAIYLAGKNTKLEFVKLNLQKPMKVNCQNCSVSVVDSKVSGHFLVGNQAVDLKGVHTDASVLVDSTSGDVKMENTRGKFSIHTASGKLNVSNHKGDLSFQSEDGGLDVSALDGNLDASTRSGQLMVEVENVSRSLHLDSEKSDIQVSLPAKFEGLLDLLSLSGELVVQFPHEINRSSMSDTYGPTSQGRMDATVGKSNGVTIHAYSKQGGVRILRKVPKR